MPGTPGAKTRFALCPGMTRWDGNRVSTRPRRENKKKNGRIELHADPETSFRYDGWRIVVVCFLLATFGWGLGFYGQSVYVAELQRLHGWPASLISSGTTFFYLFGALLVAFVSEAIKAFGPRNCLIAGTFVMAVGASPSGRSASRGSFTSPMPCSPLAGPAPALA